MTDTQRPCRQLGRLVATEHHVFRGASDMRC